MYMYYLKTRPLTLEEDGGPIRRVHIAGERRDGRVGWNRGAHGGQLPQHTVISEM